MGAYYHVDVERCQACDNKCKNGLYACCEMSHDRIYCRECHEANYWLVEECGNINCENEEVCEKHGSQMGPCCEKWLCNLCALCHRTRTLVCGHEQCTLISKEGMNAADKGNIANNREDEKKEEDDDKQLEPECKRCLGMAREAALATRRVSESRKRVEERAKEEFLMCEDRKGAEILLMKARSKTLRSVLEHFLAVSPVGHIMAENNVSASAVRTRERFTRWRRKFAKAF